MDTTALKRRVGLPALLLALPVLLAPPGAAQAQSAPRDASSVTLSAKQLKAHDSATEAFKAQRYAHAYGRFMELADAGHPPSARMALLMLQNGASLFGGEFAATTSQHRRWNAVVINAARRDGFVGVEARFTE